MACMRQKRSSIFLHPALLCRHMRVSFRPEEENHHRPELARLFVASTLYIEARRHCDQVGDFVTRALFDELIADEEGHIDFLETQMGLYDRLGAEKYGMLNAKPADQAE